VQSSAEIMNELHPPKGLGFHREDAAWSGQCASWPRDLPTCQPRTVIPPPDTKREGPADDFYQDSEHDHADPIPRPLSLQNLIYDLDSDRASAPSGQASSGSCSPLCSRLRLIYDGEARRDKGPPVSHVRTKTEIAKISGGTSRVPRGADAVIDQTEARVASSQFGQTMVRERCHERRHGSE